MHKIIVGLVLCFSFFSVSAQEVMKLRTNLKDKKVVANYHTQKIAPKSGVMYYWMAKREIHRSLGDYSGAVLTSDYEEFYLNNQLMTKGHFDDGLKTGEWKAWYPTGQLKSIYTWSKGKRHGAYRSFDEAGTPLEKGEYKNGEIHGKRYLFSADTVVVERYKNGAAVENKKKSFGLSKWWKRNKNKEEVHIIEPKKEKKERKLGLKQWFAKKNKDQSNKSTQKTKQKKTEKKKKERKWNLKSWWKRDKNKEGEGKSKR